MLDPANPPAAHRIPSSSEKDSGHNSADAAANQEPARSLPLRGKLPLRREQPGPRPRKARRGRKALLSLRSP